METARVVSRSTMRQMHAGFGANSEKEAAEQAEALAGKMVAWNDAGHLREEYHYLIPLPPEMRPAAEEDDSRAENREAAPLVDAMFLSGVFSLQYRVGGEKADFYRYLYAFGDPTAALRALFEREVTSYLAGQQFWSLLAFDPDAPPGTAQADLLKRVREPARRLMGIEVVAVKIDGIHPPAGDVGTAFQDVLAALQDKEARILRGEVDANQTLGVAPSSAHEVISKAQAYRYERETVARAEAERFLSQQSAFEKAPEAYVTRKRLESIGEAMSKVRLTLHPPGVEVRLDGSKTLTPQDLEIGRVLTGEAAKQANR